MNARYYDPETGRFISQDTYRGEDSDAGTWHLYAYCNNNPINYTDYTGHKRKGLTRAGYGFSLAVSFGALHGSLSIGIEVAWFNRIIKERYHNKSYHVFLHADTHLAAGVKNSFKENVRKKGFKIYSKAGLKALRDSIKGNARGNVSLVASYYEIFVRKGQRVRRSDYNGTPGSLSLTFQHLTVSVGWQKKFWTSGVGISLSAFNMSFGSQDYFFYRTMTNYFQGHFSKEKTKRNARR